MVKTIVSALTASLLFIFAAAFEYKFVKASFEDFGDRLSTIEIKADEQTVTYDEVLALQKFWLNNKKGLHAVIPHTEIKEIDLWLSEAVMLSEQKNYEEVIQKIEVVRELCEQIPTTFMLRFENIF